MLVLIEVYENQGAFEERCDANYLEKDMVDWSCRLLAQREVVRAASPA